MLNGFVKLRHRWKHQQLPQASQGGQLWNYIYMSSSRQGNGPLHNDQKGRLKVAAVERMFVFLKQYSMFNYQR